jgi:hypothetical protein
MNNKILIDKFLNKYKSRNEAEKLINVFNYRKKSIEDYNQKQKDFEISNQEVIKINKTPGQYLLTSDVSQPIGAKNCVIIGESVARCYGIDPLLNFKKILEATDPSYNYIDLAKTALPSQDILSHVELINEIKPEKLIVAIGNNVPSYLFLNSYYMDYLESKSINAEKYIEDMYYEFYYKPLIEKFLNEVNINKENILFFIPMGNIYGWKRRVSVISKDGSKPSKYCPVNNFILANKTNDINLLERAYEFVVDRKTTMPGLGKVSANAYRKVLKENSLNHIDFRDLLSSNEDFIDYCHLSLMGIDKVAKQVIEKLKFEFNEREYQLLFLDSKIKDKILQSKYILHKMEKQKIEYNNEFQNINNLFCGKPLLFIDSYHELLRDTVIRQILALGDPKTVLNASVENSHILQSEENLLSSKINKDFIIVSQFAKKTDRVFNHISQDKINFNFISKSSGMKKLEIGFYKEYKECKINIFLNGDLVKEDLKENNLIIEVDINKGANRLEIKVDNKSKSLMFEDFFNPDGLTIYEPKLYSLYSLKVH